MDDPAGSQEILECLSGQGVNFVVDQFGTGYTSLATMRHLAVRGPQDRPVISGEHRDRAIRCGGDPFHHRAISRTRALCRCNRRDRPLGVVSARRVRVRLRSRSVPRSLCRWPDSPPVASQRSKTSPEHGWRGSQLLGRKSATRPPTLRGSVHSPTPQVSRL